MIRHASLLALALSVPTTGFADPPKLHVIAQSSALIEPGDMLASLLDLAGLPPTQWAEVAVVLSGVYDLTDLSPGYRLERTAAPSEPSGAWQRADTHRHRLRGTCWYGSLGNRGGRIVFAGTMRGYGLAADIDHGDGVVTRSANLSEIEDGLRNGVRVKAGDLIGAVGARGLVSGPNLHYQVRVDGEPVDPRDAEVVPEEYLASAADNALLGNWRRLTGFSPLNENQKG